jgi:hypothetical protein
MKDMQRITELIHAVRATHPDDDFFRSFETDLCINDLKEDFFNTLNEALITLDNESWRILKEKALVHFRGYREGQRKQDFFNHLNEAFAYQHLVSQGYTAVKFLIDDKSNKTPDLSYIERDKEYFCEVKTIGISQDEINRRAITNLYVERSMYVKLQPEFLKKLANTICKAKEQIDAKGEGFVFLLIGFDDSTYIETYRNQITSFVESSVRTKLVIKYMFDGGLFSN